MKVFYNKSTNEFAVISRKNKILLQFNSNNELIKKESINFAQFLKTINKQWQIVSAIEVINKLQKKIEYGR